MRTRVCSPHEGILFNMFVLYAFIQNPNSVATSYLIESYQCLYSIVYYIYKGILGTATLLLIFAYCMNKNKLFVCFMQSRCLVSFIFVCVGVNVSFVIILSILLEQRNDEKFYRRYLLKLF